MSSLLAEELKSAAVMEAPDPSTCPRAILEFARARLLETWTHTRPSRGGILLFIRGFFDPLHELERKRAPEPIAYACVRWFSEIDHASQEPAGQFIAAWRISRLGDVTGPFAEAPQADNDVDGPRTVASELKINFAFGEGRCALELIRPSGEVERLLRRFEGFDCDVLGEVIGDVRRDHVSPNKYAPYFPKGWRPRP